MEGDGVACGNRLEAIEGKAGIDGLGIGERVAILPMMEAEVIHSTSDAVAAIAPILHATLCERRKLHIDEMARLPYANYLQGIGLMRQQR